MVEYYPVGLAPDSCQFSPYLTYPTADSRWACDYKAGAGVATAKSLRAYCADDGPECPIPGQPCYAYGMHETWPDKPSETPPWLKEDLSPDEMYGNATTTAQPLRQQNVVAEVVRDFGAMPEGMRIRGSLSYNSCPTAGPTTLAVGVNFDFALCGTGAGGGPAECLFVSESLDDTNEGFDVVLPHDFDQISAWLIRPQSWSPCDGNDRETFGTAFMYQWAD